MSKIILSSSEVRGLILENRYKVNPDAKFISRCIDGGYKNGPNLPALAIAGADAGELAVIFATANTYGFKLREEKVFETLSQVVGGVNNLRFHTIENTETSLKGCGYIKQLSLSPEDFQVTSEQVAFITKKAEEAIAKGAILAEVDAEDTEGAVLVITGPYGVFPQYAFETSKGKMRTQVFEFHQGLVDERHKTLSKELVKNRAVELYEGCDEEYLYEVLSSTTEDHFMETAKRLAQGLTIFSVVFEEGGDFTLEETDTIK